MCIKIAILVSLHIPYGLPKTMRNNLLYAAGKVVVKDRKQDLNAFFTMSFRNRKFEISCSAQHAPIKFITKLHKSNGYPKRFVTSTIKRTLRTCNIQPTEQELEQDTVYAKVIFINEDLKQQTQAVIKRSGIQNIKAHYMTGRPLLSIFRPPKEQQKCPESRETCISAKKVNKCFS